MLICLCLLVVVTRQAVHAALEAHTARRVQAGEMIGVRPWMTIPYIARTYGIPENTLYAAIGIAASSANSHAPLQVIAKREGQPINGYIVTLNAIIDQSPPRRRNKPTSPASPATPATPEAAP